MTIEPEDASERAIEEYSRASEQGPPDAPPGGVYEVAVVLRVVGVEDERAARLFVSAIIGEGVMQFGDDPIRAIAGWDVESVEAT